MFGGAGNASITYSIAPFSTSDSTGLSTVPADPTTALGIATQQYVGGKHEVGYLSTNQTVTTLAAVNGMSFGSANGIAATDIWSFTAMLVLSSVTNGFVCAIGNDSTPVYWLQVLAVNQGSTPNGAGLISYNSTCTFSSAYNGITFATYTGVISLNGDATPAFNIAISANGGSLTVNSGSWIEIIRQYPVP
jgi:hypothetical protein